MRVSCDVNDRGYKNYFDAQKNGKKIVITLDGKVVKHCTVADEEMGFIVQLVMDENDNIQIDPIDQDKVWTERVYGDVEVKFE